MHCSWGTYLPDHHQPGLLGVADAVVFVFCHFLGHDFTHLTDHDLDHLDDLDPTSFPPFVMWLA